MKDFQSNFQELVTLTIVTKVTVEATCCFVKCKGFEFIKCATI